MHQPNHIINQLIKNGNMVVFQEKKLQKNLEFQKNKYMTGKKDDELLKAILEGIINLRFQRLLYPTMQPKKSLDEVRKMNRPYFTKNIDIYSKDEDKDDF